MQGNQEQQFGTAFVLIFLLAVFMMLFQPWQIGLRELHWREGLFATNAAELRGFFDGVRAHGELLGSGFPLFPYAARCLMRLGASAEFALRWLSLLPVLGTAAWVFFLGRSVSGATCGGIAAGVWLTANIVLEKALDGYPEMAMIFFVAGGQFWWFTLGHKFNRWNAAWIGAGCFGALAFFTGGFPAIFYLITPFVFQRRPLSLVSKLKFPGAFAGGAILALAVAVWLLPFAAEPDGGREFVDATSLAGYYAHLATFPFDAVWRIMPWSLLAWPVFCAAYRPLDPAPIFSRFLRTVTISTFFLLWFSPFTEVRDIPLLLPSLSILIAENYQLLVRRHAHVYRRLMRPFSYAIILAGMVITVFFVNDFGVGGRVCRFLNISDSALDFRFEPLHRAQGLAYGALIFLIGLYLLCRRKTVPLWIAGVLIMTTPLLAGWAISRSAALSNSPKREFGERIASSIAESGYPSDKLVYKLNIGGLYGEMYYSGHPVKKLASLSDLPEDEEDVLLLSTGFPQYPEREWAKLMDGLISDRNLHLYRGRLIGDAASGVEAAR